MSQDGNELLRRARDGDEDAIEDLLSQNIPGLKGYVRKNAGQIIGARESVADLVQSVCREALQHAADGRLEYRGKAAFKDWLYNAATMKMMNRARFWNAEKRDVRKERPLPSENTSAPPPAMPRHQESPSYAVVRTERAVAFQAAFRRLDDEQQGVILLAHVEGLSHREIAERLGITESLSRTRLSRAMARLARYASKHR